MTIACFTRFHFTKWVVSVSRFCLICTWIFCQTEQVEASPATFLYKNNGNGASVVNQTSATTTDGAYQMEIAAVPAGSVFFIGSNGMGVNPNGLNDPNGIGTVFDTEPDKISIPRGTAPSVAGLPEAITFSFNRNGVIRDLLFDGVKDENLEFARLILPDGNVMTFMDSEVPTKLADQGFSLADITEPNIHLLVDGNDDLNGVSIPFLAGEVFTLTYGEFPYPVRQDLDGPIPYVPVDPQAPNGYRLEGVRVVPEPACGFFFAAAVVGLQYCRFKLVD